ncbi:MAG: hypothetical protein Q8M03_05295, partial [Legionella sp.]|nr:hypothetical protein [Legionella sp.]
MSDVASALTRNIPAARGINLKWHLVRRIVVVAGLCFLAGAAFAVYRAADDARAQNTAIAEAVARQLEVQLFRIDSALDIAERFPDWDAVVSYGLAAGQCVQFANEGGSPLNSSCAGADNRMIPAPGWFASLYRMAFDGTTQAVRAVTFRGKSRGKIIASSDPVTVAARAWAAISPLLGLSAVLMSALCILVYGVIARALKPAQEILAGLNRVAGGDLTSRLPSF